MPAVTKDLGATESVLDAGEIERARRIVAAGAREQFIVGRVLLRSVVGRYLGRPAAALEFTTSERGKVSLRGESGTRLAFNVSHSGRFAICAIATRRVGVDIEYIRTEIDVAGLSRLCFGPHERRDVTDYPAAGRLRVFYELWTRKEAYVKATGEGLARDLLDFEVAPIGMHRGRALRAHCVAAECDRWTFVSLPLADDYAGTLVAEGSDWGPRYWRWQPS
ncbi:MAG: 4'-phosphopantetheinyl transferase superfamily protein [Candidatus Eremiobacteraeota bacterium]|nr:4'-phosphopantetheinyl transferase superfamily protein [Candidatus Eremiobacteraeota bacterium]